MSSVLHESTIFSLRSCTHEIDLIMDSSSGMVQDNVFPPTKLDLSAHETLEDRDFDKGSGRPLARSDGAVELKLPSTSGVQIERIEAHIKTELVSDVSSSRDTPFTEQVEQVESFRRSTRKRQAESTSVRAPQTDLDPCTLVLRGLSLVFITIINREFKQMAQIWYELSSWQV